MQPKGCTNINNLILFKNFRKIVKISSIAIKSLVYADFYTAL